MLFPARRTLFCLYFKTISEREATDGADVIVIDLVDDDDEDEEEEEDKMTEFVEQDIEHLKFKLFSVSRSLAVRIFSLNIQFYKWQEMVIFFNQSQHYRKDTEPL